MFKKHFFNQSLGVVAGGDWGWGDRWGPEQYRRHKAAQGLSWWYTGVGMAVQVQLKRNFKARSLRPCWSMQKVSLLNNLISIHLGSTVFQPPYRMLEGREKLSKSIPSFKEVQCGQFSVQRKEGQRQIRWEPRKDVDNMCRDSKMAGVSGWHWGCEPGGHSGIHLVGLKKRVWGVGTDQSKGKQRKA